MASLVSHVVAAATLGSCFPKSIMSRRVWLAGVVCSMLPDLDVIGFHFGVHYGDFWGHRGFTHSLAFAALLAGVATLLTRGTVCSRPGMIWFFLFLATASHGLLDAMTNGGLGVAFFSPFDLRRYFLPFRPILVSPIGIDRFFSAHGMAVLASEALWIWIPCFALVAAVWAMRASRLLERGAEGKS